MNYLIISLTTIGFSIVAISCNNTNQKPEAADTSDIVQVALPQDACNWCGTSEAPEDVSWRTIIPPEEEPGEKTIISGTVFQADGQTPAEEIIIYVYHTNIEGIYAKTGNEQGNGEFHGYLRGWMKTDSLGRYEFETIRPAPYQTHGGEPAHIHYNIQGPDHPEYWLTALWFENDPRVNEAYLESVKRNGGFSNVTSLRKDEHGILRGTRNIILERFED
jgi:protocatechuate 3,4-dioxygenase beta subunit